MLYSPLLAYRVVGAAVATALDSPLCPQAAGVAAFFGPTPRASVAEMGVVKSGKIVTPRYVIAAAISYMWVTAWLPTFSACSRSRSGFGGSETPEALDAGLVTDDVAVLSGYVREMLKGDALRACADLAHVVVNRLVIEALGVGDQDGLEAGHTGAQCCQRLARSQSRVARHAHRMIRGWSGRRAHRAKRGTRRDRGRAPGRGERHVDVGGEDRSKQGDQPRA